MHRLKGLSLRKTEQRHDCGRLRQEPQGAKHVDGDLRDEAKKDLAIAALQDKYNGKINISDREVEEYYSANRQLFKNERGVALAMIVVDPADNSNTGITDDAKNEADAKIKIDNIYQQTSRAKQTLLPLLAPRAKKSTACAPAATSGLRRKRICGTTTSHRI